MIIGLCGYKGAGKTELTTRASEMSNYQFTRIGFSDPLYQMLHAMGVPIEVLKDKSRWDEPLDILCGKSTRHACDTLGTDWGQNHIGTKVWVNAALNIAKQLHDDGYDVVIDNVRFLHEAQAIRDNRGVLIALHRTDRALPDTIPYADSFVGTIQRNFCEIHFHNSGVGPEANARRLLQLFETIKSRSAS